MDRLIAQANLMKRVLPNHSIVKKIGKGGFGEVFLTEDKQTREKLALKLMHFSPTETKEVIAKRKARFKREMKLTSELEHQHIVKLIRSGECEESNLLYSLFEYIPGETLAEIIKKEGALPIKRAVRLMEQTLSAILTAHKKGVIHRDLKPDNILITNKNGIEEVKIFDFGISTFNPLQRDDITRLTITREFLGTPLYSAPEQLRGEPVTVKSDLYSWGLLFLECLTGKHPYTGISIAEIVQKQLSTTPVPLPLTLTNHPLGTFFSWILNKETQRRAGDAELILSRLKKIAFDTLSDDMGFLKNSRSLRRPFLDTLPRETQKSTKMSERRQITALSIKLALKAHSDAIKEDILDEIYHTIIEICCEIIEETGGHIEGQVYEKINALFGYPEVHGRDVHRAARVGLELFNSLKQRNRILNEEQGITLDFSIGLHTGMVTIREGKRGNRVVGVAPSVAGKLCEQAGKQEYVISEESYKLLHKYLKCEERPHNEGAIYNVIEEKSIDMQNRKTLRLTGRDMELTLLQNHCDKQESPILLLGEAGIGKSRLTSELITHIQTHQKPFLEYRCLPEGQNSALYPIFSQLKREIDLPIHDTTEVTMTELESYIEKLQLPLDTTLPYLCLWLGITSNRYKAPVESPKMQKEHIVATILKILQAESKIHNTLHIFEDLHWADPTTIEVISRFAEEAKKERIFFLLTGRPDFVSPWKRSLITTITLERMSDDQIREIIENTAETMTLPAALIDKMVERSDGVPLFAEELARMFSESGYRDTKSTVDSEEFLIPDSLKDLLSSRLNRLGVAKETAQLAATLGRSFDYKLLTKISNIDEAVLLADLDQLVSAGIINMQYRADDNPQYSFKHSLVRDAAYSSMTSSIRSNIHQSIAEALAEEDQPERESNLWQRAYHWSQAGNFEKAVPFAMESLKTASKNAHYLEAINQGEEVLGWLFHLPEDKTTIESILGVTQILISCYSSYYSFSYKKIEECFDSTNHLLEKLPKSSRRLFPAYWSRLFYYYTKANYTTSEFYWEKANEACNDDPAFKAALHCYKANFERLQSNFESSLSHVEKALTYHEQAEDFDYTLYFGHDIKIISLFTRSLSQSLMGDVTTGRITSQQTLEYAEKLGQITGIGQALVYRLLLLVQQNDREAVIESTQQLRPYLVSHAQGFLMPMLELLYGWATSNMRICRENYDIMSSHGFAQPASFFNFIVARVEYENSDYPAAIKRIEPFIGNINDQWESFYIPELLLLKAKIQFKTNKTAEAKDNINQAYSIAMDDNSHLFALRVLLAMQQFGAEVATRIHELIQRSPQLQQSQEYQNYQER